MFRALIENIYCFINNHRLTNEKIKTILDKKLRELLDEHKADIYAVYWDEFDEAITNVLEGAEPNDTTDDSPVCAFSTISDNGIPTMFFSIEAIRRDIRYMNPLKVEEEIEGVAKHEAYHVLQFLYVFDHGGVTSLDKLFADVEQCDYWDNVLEKGAYLFQWLDIEQDFSRDFAPYVNKVCE